jgi:multidrug efflux system membrane fusion protein
VKTGSLQEDGLRVIEPYRPASGKEPESGVKPDEWVVVGGLQQLRPRTEVKPDQAPMPTLAGGDPGSSRRKPQPPPPGGKKK